ncbi:MAG: putative damage-inducible protein DinB [Saprospiraceae bacterium]|jgi:uncharacterized damage-inducible protein DinB
MRNRYLKYAQYNLWANNKLRKLLSANEDILISKKVISSFPSIRKTIQHFWGAEKIWLLRLNGVSPTVLSAYNFDGILERMYQNWCKESLNFLTFIEYQLEEWFDESTEFLDTQGDLHEIKNCEILQHVFNHSNYHRGQVVLLMRQLGMTNMEGLDYIAWARLHDTPLSDADEKYLDYADYNIWANKQLINHLLDYEDSVLEQNVVGSFPNIKETLRHIWFAEEGWLSRLKGKDWNADKSVNFKGSNEDLVVAWHTTSIEFRNFIEDIDLEKPISYTRNGKKHTIASEEIAQTVFNHGSYHRGQIITIMRQLGIEEMPRTDYIEWVNVVMHPSDSV